MSTITLPITKTTLCHLFVVQTTPNSYNYCVETVTLSPQVTVLNNTYSCSLVRRRICILTVHIFVQ